MKFRFLAALIVVVFAASLAGCKKDDEPENEQKEDRSKFAELYGDIDATQTWNMAVISNIKVICPDATEYVGVYIDTESCTYLLADKTKPVGEEVLSFDMPTGIDRLKVVVDNHVYETSPNSTIDATAKNGSTVSDNRYANAVRLGWIVAAEKSKGKDFDFNDVVMRFECQPDGDLCITAMCCGMEDDVWLHYTDGFDDFIVSPEVYDGPMMEQKYIDFNSAEMYELHRWFYSESGSSTSGYTINTFGSGGANGKKGHTVTLKAELFDDFSFSITDLCTTKSATDKGGHEYGEVKSGFYFTVGTYNMEYVDDENEKYAAVISALPPGGEAAMLVLPDIGGFDTHEKFVGWHWPLESSRIDLPYPFFARWVGNAGFLWSTTEPGGWNNRPTQIDENGNFIYFGYYPRQ